MLISFETGLARKQELWPRKGKGLDISVYEVTQSAHLTDPLIFNLGLWPYSQCNTRSNLRKPRCRQ